MKEFFKKLLSFFSRKETLAGFAIGKESLLDQEVFKVIESQSTPNPDAYRFQLNKTATEFDSINFSSQEEASEDSFAKTVFNLYGVENIFIKDDFITITKSPVVGWGALIEMVGKAVTSSLNFYPKKVLPNESSLKKLSDSDGFAKDDFLSFPDSEKEKIVNAIFDQSIRPALANDGGDLTLIGIKGEEIRIRYEGACGTCPSSSQGTLKFIEEMIRENLHPSLKVISI
jgi:Fe-S cluster biogenesis protein NfuA|tara:strand:- start:915 stop:1601 length:687 start_codon:yes stop_codon:yes gene_type:complete